MNSDISNKDNKIDRVRESQQVRKNEQLTYEDYLSWNDNQRYELIEGKVYNMTPAPSRLHQKISGELFRQIANYLSENDCEIYAAPFDVRLIDTKDKEDNNYDEKIEKSNQQNNSDIITVVQPDLVVVCDEDNLDEKGCLGAPDLIIEITSPSSAARDRKVKRNLYEKHNVKEYWIVDPNVMVTEVYLLNEDNKYSKPNVYTKKDEISVDTLSDLKINLDQIFGN